MELNELKRAVCMPPFTLISPNNFDIQYIEIICYGIKLNYLISVVTVNNYLYFVFFLSGKVIFCFKLQALTFRVYSRVHVIVITPLSQPNKSHRQ